MRTSAVLRGIAAMAMILSTVTGCGDDESGPTTQQPTEDASNGGDSSDPPETSTGDTGEPSVCTSNAECADNEDPGPCQQWICDNTLGQCKKIGVTNGTSCDDDDPCTTADQCSGGACMGQPKSCSDKNLCTDDSCDGATGECEYTNNTAACDDDNLCTDGDRCADGTCQGTPNDTCQCEVDGDCAQFDDGNLCNGVLECDDGTCVPQPDSAIDCGDATGACQERICEPATGTCKDQKLTDGTACDDGSACTKSDRCQGGTCQGQDLVCDDDNPCTDDACDPATGCTFTNNSAACDDGDLCTVDDACAEGVCTGADNPECDCAGNEDCAEFEDGDVCNGTLICDGGACVVDPATKVDCSDEAAAAPACQTVTCQKATGQCVQKPALDGAACDDESACTKSDHCEAGACVGAPVVCDDGNGCTTDGCDPATGCTTTDDDGATCDDGNPCTSEDVCAGGACEGTGDCGCESTEDCLQFEDGNKCNGAMECIEGQCKVNPSTIVTCEAATSPCATVACVPASGECKSAPKADGTVCDDGSACTSDDVCDGGACKGAKVLCDDGNLCTDDVCEAETGCVHDFNTASCDDGNVCTTGDACKEGECRGTPQADCGCDTDADCEDNEDGNLCNGTLICVSGKCVTDPETVVVCPPLAGSPCQSSVCGAESGECEVVDAEDGKPCDDADECTTGDTCAAGTCEGSGTIDCDDGNPCTDDACEAAIGCANTPNSATCDDGDPCTEGDVCDAGACMPGDTNVCEDQCEAQWTLSCGSFDAWSTADAGATDVIGQYSCSPDEYPGSEYTYLFKAPYDGNVRVSLSEEEIITDVMILEQTDLGCDPKACATFGFATASTEMQAGKSYYFVVDGFQDLTGGYVIDVDCTPGSEQICDDGVDEDADDLLDCEDPDCADDPACAPPQCDAFWVLDCGESDSWFNYGFGSTDLFGSYEGCGNAYSYGGPEYAYVFTAPVDGEVTVALTQETAQTDVIVLGDQGGACLPDSCVGWGLSSATFEAVAGETYYVLVDGFNGAEGGYRIDVTCPVEPDTTETKCSDEVDNDQDGDVDCADEDCAGLPVCDTSCKPKTQLSFACGDTTTLSTENPLYAKNATVSYGCNDFDYTGPELSGRFVAPFDGTATVSLSQETGDTDILVVEAGEDGTCEPGGCVADGLSDATFTMEEGKTYFLVVDGFAGEKGSFELSLDCAVASEFNCSDGVDEDADGLIDCQDDDCYGVSASCEPACVPDSVSQAQLTCPEDDDSYTNTGVGSTANIDRYQGCSPYTYDGSEYVYTYEAQVSGEVTVELDEDGIFFADDLDLFVLREEGLGCNPASCIAWHDDDVTFDAVAGTTYYIVVDGFNGAENDYDLIFSCGE